jgi:hypothetical protein
MTARALGVPAVVLATLAVLGCGGGGPTTLPETLPAEAARAGPALCAPLGSRVTGRVRTPAATELSGLVLSRTRPGVLWALNDSGDSARLLALRRDGTSVGEVAVTGAQAYDWEDIASARGTLYVGDIGDNAAERESVTVYRVAEPRLDGAPTATAPAEALVLRYPDGAHDAEALMVTERGVPIVVTKSFGGRSGVYAARGVAPGKVTTMKRAGGLVLGPGEAVTAGDISADGRTIVLRTYGRAFVWRRRKGESVVTALRRQPCRAGASLLSEGQGEALALNADGRAFFTVPEGAEPPLRRYAPARR